MTHAIRCGASHTQTNVRRGSPSKAEQPKRRCSWAVGRTPSRAILEPDRLSLYPPEEVAEGYIFETLGEKYVLSDGVRTIDIYHIQGLAHCAGMLIAYLPKEKIVVEADLYSPRGAQAPRYAQCQ